MIVTDKANIRIPLPREMFMRPLRESDASHGYVSALNDRERTKYMTSLNSAVSQDDLRAYINDNYNNSHNLLLGVFDGDALLGTCRLHDIDFHAGTTYLGIFIFESLSKYKGLGTSVITAACDFAFTDLGIKTVNAGIFIDNMPSVRAFTKAGFQVVDSDEYHGKAYQRWALHKPSRCQ